MASQDFVSTATLTDAPQLEPSLEHLLRDATLDNGTILALRHCWITDRETCGARGYGGGLEIASKRHRQRPRIQRHAAQERVCKDFHSLEEGQSSVGSEDEYRSLAATTWKPGAMPPEDWTSVVVQFKKKVGSDLQDEELPPQFYCEDFQARLQAGMFRAEPSFQVISFAETEQQDIQRPDPSRRYGIHLNAQLTLQIRKEYTSVPLQEHRRAPRKIRSHGEHAASGSALAARAPTTFQKILKQLLGKQDFNLHKEVQTGNIACLLSLNSERKCASNAEKHDAPQPNSSNDALVAVGEFGKLTTNSFVVVGTRQGPEGARGAAQRGSSTLPHAQRQGHTLSSATCHHRRGAACSAGPVKRV